MFNYEKHESCEGMGERNHGSIQMDTDGEPLLLGSCGQCVKIIALDVPVFS